MATQSVIYALFPFLSLLLSGIAIYFSRRDRHEDAIAQTRKLIERLHDDLDAQHQRLEDMRTHFAVEIAKLNREYRNGGKH